MISQKEKAYKELSDAITYGDLKPGEKLVEKEICEIYKIGRTPLREALFQLQTEGYVKVLNNRGAFISKISIGDVEEIYNIVARLEGYAAGLATKYINATDKKELRAIQNTLKEAGLKRDYKNWLEKNALFHGYFSNITGNLNLCDTVDGLRKRIYRYRFIAITIPGHIEEYTSAHEKVLKAVFKREPEQATNAMQEHVLYVKKVLVEFLKQFPGL